MPRPDSRITSIAVFLCSSILLLAAPLARAQTQVTIRAPLSGQPVDDVFTVIATIQGSFEITSASASVNGVSVALVFSPTGFCTRFACSPAWTGNLDISSLPRGSLTLVVTGTDAMGTSGSASIPIVHDRPPVLQVTAPLPDSVARPRIRVTATCTDDDPGGCASLNVRSPDGVVLLSGSSAIDGDIDLGAYDGREIELQFRVTDSAGQLRSLLLPVNVDRSVRIRKVAQVPGKIWDADGQRILHAAGSKLYIRDRASGSDTPIYSSLSTDSFPHQYGFLTAAGAAFAVEQVAFPFEGGKSWESGVLVELGGLNGSTSLRGKGRYLIWTNGNNPWQLYRRDVVSGSTLMITSDASNIDNDVAANGTVSYWTYPGYNVFLYRPDGSTSQLTFDSPTSWNTYNRTDGNAVVYAKVPPCCGSAVPDAIAYNKDGVEEMLSPSGLRSPGYGFDISNGWVAYTKKGPSGVMQVWRRDPQGAQSQVTFFSTDSQLNYPSASSALAARTSLGPDGTVLVTDTMRRHLSSAPGTSVVNVNSVLGSSFFIGGNPHLAIGNALFAIQFSESSFNGDVRSDLLWRNSATGQVYRMLMNGLAITGEAMAYVEPNTAWRIVADGDFNGDGVADLLWRNVSTGQVFMMPFGANGLPSGGAFIYTEANPAWKIVATPDLDGDGRADLVWWNAITGQVYVMLIDGFAIKAQGFIYTEPNTAWRIVGTGNFFGTGTKNGLLWHNSVTGQVFLMRVAASGNSIGVSGGSFPFQEPNTSWKILAAADFNADDKPDILWRNDSTGQVSVMLMNGESVSSSALVHQEPNLAWKIVAQGDYNGDGKADLLWRNEATGQVYMMLMNGTTIASQGMVYQEPNTAWRLQGAWEYSQ